MALKPFGKLRALSLSKRRVRVPRGFIVATDIREIRAIRG
jgi:hypothetical protein